MKVQMTAVQRMAVQTLFNRRESRTLKDQIIPFAVIQKIKFTDAEDGSLLEDVVDNGVVIGRRLKPGSDEEIPVEIDFTTKEAGEIINLLETSKIGPMDVAWIAPLKEQLEG